MVHLYSDMNLMGKLAACNVAALQPACSFGRFDTVSETSNQDVRMTLTFSNQCQLGPALCHEAGQLASQSWLFHEVQFVLSVPDLAPTCRPRGRIGSSR